MVAHIAPLFPLESKVATASAQCALAGHPSSKDPRPMPVDRAADWVLSSLPYRPLSIILVGQEPERKLRTSLKLA